MREVEAVGKNIEQAIDNALFELKAPREDVDIKIISEGGLFRKAKVKVSISADALEKYEKKKEIKAEEKKEDIVIKKEETVIEPVKEETAVEVKEVVEEKPKKERKEVEAIDPEEFLKGLFESYCKDVTITKTEEDNFVKYQVTGDNLNELIGYRGETLSAISYLTQVAAGRGSKKVVVDIENYREKRAQTLKELANRVASKVAKTGRYQKLEPMEPSERRIIHLALQDNDKVTTMSKGTEPNRYIIVFPREYKE